MTDEALVPSSEQPIRIRWLNAVEQNGTIPKPIAHYPQVPMARMTAPSVLNKARTKVPGTTNVVRFIDQIPQPPLPTAAASVEMSMHASKGLKELSTEDKLKIANLIKELARLGHEKEVVQTKLEHERKLFEVQMKTLLNDYEKLMKDNQKLQVRYQETKMTLNEYEKRAQLSSRSATEFPDPQRSSTPIDLTAIDGRAQPPTVASAPKASTRTRSEGELIAASRTASTIITEQFQLKQLMMEKQLELLHKQQQILERELREKNAHQIIEQTLKSSSTSPIKPISPPPAVQTTTRATSPIKRESKSAVVERATSPVKQPTTSVKILEKQANRNDQIPRASIVDDEDLLVLSLNESAHDLDKRLPSQNIHKKPLTRGVMSVSNADSEEQNLLKDIFFIC